MSGSATHPGRPVLTSPTEHPFPPQPFLPNLQIVLPTYSNTTLIHLPKNLFTSNGVLTDLTATDKSFSISDSDTVTLIERNAGFPPRWIEDFVV